MERSALPLGRPSKYELVGNSTNVIMLKERKRESKPEREREREKAKVPGHSVSKFYQRL